MLRTAEGVCTRCLMNSLLVRGSFSIKTSISLLKICPFSLLQVLAMPSLFQEGDDFYMNSLVPVFSSERD